MYVDYTNLNTSYMKYSYPLANIEKLIDNSVGYMLLSFINAYSEYNQIPMFGHGRIKTSFMTEHDNY